VEMMENDIQSKSKTQIKKEAEELQKLGEELTKMTKQQLERLEISDKLRNALIDARSIKSNIAARRHRQFIGALMRDVDPEPLRLALLHADTDIVVESESAKQIKIWIDKLLTSDSTIIEEFILAYPGIDRQRLRQLLRNISKEKKNKKSSKSLRTLEQIIIKCLKEK
jgi:ribosome-associated protein